MDLDGQAKAKLEGRGRIILPGQEAKIVSKWGGELTNGTYTALVTVVFGKERATVAEHNFTIGKP
jgi:hypothetical protein